MIGLLNVFCYLFFRRLRSGTVVFNYKDCNNTLRKTEGMKKIFFLAKSLYFRLSNAKGTSGVEHHPLLKGGSHHMELINGINFLLVVVFRTGGAPSIFLFVFLHYQILTKFTTYLLSWL